MIEIETLPAVSKNFKWDDAWLYCMCLYINGKSDWRMPTHKDAPKLPAGNSTTWVDAYSPDNSHHVFQIVPVRTCNDGKEYTIL